jgi:cysteine synthase
MNGNKWPELSAERERLYNGLKCPPTVLREIKEIDIPNRNRILVKQELDNPTQSHYDRIFPTLLRSLETDKTKPIIPDGDQILLEASSGNGALAFAHACKHLKYPFVVIVPHNVSVVNLQQIRSYEPVEVVIGEQHQYMDSVIRKIRPTYSKLMRESGSVRFIDHAGVNYRLSLKGIETIGQEIIDAVENGKIYNIVKSSKIEKIDYFIACLGNGLSMYGPYRKLREKWPGIKAIGVEPYESPSVLAAVCGESFEDLFKARYGESPTFGIHELIGTGPFAVGNGNDSNKPYPVKKLSCIKTLIDENIITKDNIKLVKRDQWQEKLELIKQRVGLKVGPTSGAGLEIALQLAIEEEDKVIVVIFYDTAEKYNPFNVTYSLEQASSVLKSEVHNS